MISPDTCISILKVTALLCVSIVFAYSMMPRIERFLPKPREECWPIFIVCFCLVAAFYFAFRQFCYDPAKRMIVEKFFWRST